MHSTLATNNRFIVAAKTLCLSLLVMLLLFITKSAGGHVDVMSNAAYRGEQGSKSHANQRATLSTHTVLTSTLSGCMEIKPDRLTVKTAESQMLLIWEGTPTVAHLVLSSCGVKPDRHHTVYLNGQPVAQVEDDVYHTCICYSSGQPVTYTLSNPSVVASGWNVISITNDADVTDDWLAYWGHIVLEGDIDGPQVSDVTFISSFDQMERRAGVQVPAGYDPATAVPLLVSIGGSGEGREDAIHRFAERASARGWLLLGPDIRWADGKEKGRTASVAVQHDIVDAVDYLLADSAFNVDPARIYLSGFSTGGGIAATVAAKYPHRFAAVVDWAGPTDLKAWVEQRPGVENSLIRDIGCGLHGPGCCPWEWKRRSALHMAMNLKHVPMAIVHGRADDSVPFAQSESFYNYMADFYDPDAHNKLALWHDGDHVDLLATFEGLDFVADFTLNDNPADIKIRADESKDYYWVYILQKDWNGNRADGYSDVEASYDLATQVISATIWDERPFRNGNLPLDVTFDLRTMGFDPYATYTIEDQNVATGDFEIRQGVLPLDGRLPLSLDRDHLGRVHHQYLIYPFEPPELHRIAFQQGVSPTTGYQGVQDTYIYQYSPVSNYAGASVLKINYGRALRSLLKFDLQGIPHDAVVKQALLTLYRCDTHSGGLDVSLHTLLRSWTDEEATWNAPWSSPGAEGDYDPTPLAAARVWGGPNPINLKPLLKDWLTGLVPNEGVLIVGPQIGSGNDCYCFDSSNAGDKSKRPLLEVLWMDPTATLTATPTNTATPTPTATATATATPTQTATFTPVSYRLYLPLIIK